MNDARNLKSYAEDLLRFPAVLTGLPTTNLLYRELFCNKTLSCSSHALKAPPPPLPHPTPPIPDGFFFFFRPEAQWSIFVHGLCFVRIVLYFSLLTLCNYFKKSPICSFLDSSDSILRPGTSLKTSVWSPGESNVASRHHKVSVRVLGFGIPSPLVVRNECVPSTWKWWFPLLLLSCCSSSSSSWTKTEKWETWKIPQMSPWFPPYTHVLFSYVIKEQLVQWKASVEWPRSAYSAILSRVVEKEQQLISSLSTGQKDEEITE